jgi:hypothetical protein
MSGHLRLPHPHLAEVVAEALRDAAHHFQKPKPVYTDPAVIEAWGRWLTPEQWERQHSGRSEE